MRLTANSSSSLVHKASQNYKDLVYTRYLAAAENVETTTESATTVTVNDQTTAADSELTTVTDEVTVSQTQTQTGITAFYCVVF